MFLSLFNINLAHRAYHRTAQRQHVTPFRQVPQTAGYTQAATVLLLPRAGSSHKIHCLLVLLASSSSPCPWSKVGIRFGDGESNTELHSVVGTATVTKET